jgi:hypothetical protein
VIKFCQCQRFSPGNLVSSTNKTDRHDITGILLKVTLNTITLTLKSQNKSVTSMYQSHQISLETKPLEDNDLQSLKLIDGWLSLVFFLEKKM